MLTFLSTVIIMIAIGVDMGVPENWTSWVFWCAGGVPEGLSVPEVCRKLTY
jgi:hypothetical protein